ncbi:mechanosensitive ion channel domain-containing protein [uncultured Sulfitobacter sp.]|uniref:mechanosensitive ion channel family protein n=1 Tax=uncultured Sulfitobacter sp. TaxID=191468 RepID=UPI00260F6C78|nr:mechanosensitive ion channel domain-containing protein [uncultured Sulfitobacter sp.]
MSIIFLFWLLARGISALIRRSARSRGRDSLAEVAGSLIKWAIIVVGFMLGFTIAAPTVSPGDQIASGGHEGTVENIETRATLIITYDGRRVVIPNSEFYADSVGCNDDWDATRQIMEEACASVSGVSKKMATETIPCGSGRFCQRGALALVDEIRPQQSNSCFR